MGADKISQVVTKIWIAPFVTALINPIILLLAAAAFVVFLWGVFEFVRDAGDAEKRQSGRASIMYGIVGLVIIFGAYGLINIALTAFNLPNIQKIVTSTQPGGDTNGTCVAAGNATGTGGTATDPATMVAGSASIAANTGTNSCAALTPTSGNVYKEVSLNQCSCSNTQGTVCCGEFPASQRLELTLSASAFSDISETASSVSSGGTGSCADTVTSAQTLDAGIAALKQLMLTCPREVSAEFTEYAANPTENGWNGFQIGGALSVKIFTNETSGQAVGWFFDEGNAPQNTSTVPDYGVMHFFHTHPGVIKSTYAPPSLGDVASYCDIQAEGLGVSVNFATRFNFYVVAPEALYSLDCVPFAQQLTNSETFRPADHVWTAQDITDFGPYSVGLNDSANALANHYEGEIVDLQDIYAGTDASGSFVYSTASAAEKKTALDKVIGIYRSMGVSVITQPW